ncbi:IucA/IucC family siderophore biosynthesis protein [Brevibacillus sp. HB1.4B]|uniref:IucA/IucC family protein n=1 Tax=Brevibacillus sp. HB1.4B TaxID=2738845 RepID=UPI00156B40EA|nr:IucA/IucC family protein [Brevibacillus sp. HB1.4B]NRS16857.1 IucA/IucC family siderophore biosynthesis protein [Brevibacillus sp. HB1.4B]
MFVVKHIAEHATMQSFLNCYLRETGRGEWIDRKDEITKQLTKIIQPSTTGKYLHCELPHQGISLYVGVKYHSVTGRHLFHYPACYRSGDCTRFVQADYLTLAVLLIKELTLQHGENAVPDELVLRMIQSCQSIEKFVRTRQSNGEILYGMEQSFIEAEQALLFGHLFHPTPKSQQGIPEAKQALYAPECCGRFQLHLFAAHPSIVHEKSGLTESATQLLKGEFPSISDVDPSFSIVPIHPLQAEWLLEQVAVQSLIEKGLLLYIGPAGEEYMATSSLRTVYHPEKKYMLKLSVPIKVTNSLRINKLSEMEIGLEAKQLFETGIGEVSRKYPGFGFISDPAYITITLDQAEETGFEVILRDNPFMGSHARQVTQIAALVQDPLPGYKSRLATLIHHLAQKEGKALEVVSLEWFKRYVDISLKPMVWLYLKYGIGLEAHQQNSVVTLKDGYPAQFFYRDNQGYYFSESMQDVLETELPGIGKASKNIYKDHLVDERITYYMVFNHMFGLINGFGTEGLIDEKILLAEMHEVLTEFLPMNREASKFLENLLTRKQLPCKANLLTRFYDLDELTQPEERSSVFVYIDNPLAKVKQTEKAGLHAFG